MRYVCFFLYHKWYRWSRRHALIFSHEKSKITTHCWTTINRRILDPTNKRYSTSKAKEKPQQDGRRGKIMFRAKSHTRQRHLEGSNKTLCAPGPRYPAEMEPDLCLSLLQWYGSAVVCCRDRGSVCNYSGHTACGISHLGGGHHYTTKEPPSRWSTSFRTIIPKIFLHC